MKDRIDDTDWDALGFGQRLERLEVDGYAVVPGLLGDALVEELRDAVAEIDVRATDYTDRKVYCNDIQWQGGVITELIAHPPTIALLRRIFGGEPVMMTYDYARSDPGCPPINLHCDGQPWGSRIFGPEQSCPRLVRVLYYLQDLTSESAPFRVVPRSHLSFHNDANPYLRYREHPEQVMVTCRAGSAVLINQNVFHGNYPNQGDLPRHMLGIAYRPEWSGPCGDVASWDSKHLAEVPQAVREVMTDRNQRIWNYDGENAPPDMSDEAPGISPSRWRER